MIPPILSVLAVASAELLNPVLAPGAVLSAEAQWHAISASPRVVVGDKKFFGTAVVVGHRNGFAYLLTAAHVVDGVDDLEFHFFTRASGHEPAIKLKGGEVVLRSEKPDFALVRLKVEGMRLPEVPLAGPGQRPRRFPFAAVSVGCGFGGRPQTKAEEISAKLLKRAGDMPEAFFWRTADRPDKGRSGGPLLDADGRVIGICAATQDEKGYFTHLDELLAALKKAGYDWLWKAK